MWRVLVDVKLKPVVGESSETAKPELAESLISGRSMANIRQNLLALRAMYLGESDDGFSALVTTHGDDAELDRLIRKAFAVTIETTYQLQSPLSEAVVHTDNRQHAEKLLLQTRALKQIIRDRLASKLGLAVGFNALDGD